MDFFEEVPFKFYNLCNFYCKSSNSKKCQGNWELQHLSQRAVSIPLALVTATIAILPREASRRPRKLRFHLGLHFMSFTPWKCLFSAVLSAHGEFKQASSSSSSSLWKDTFYSGRHFGELLCNIKGLKNEPVTPPPPRTRTLPGSDALESPPGPIGLPQTPE